MHSYHSENVTIHHNGDFSGDAIVSVQLEGYSMELAVPCKALVNFSKAATIREVIYKLEGMEE